MGPFATRATGTVLNHDHAENEVEEKHEDYLLNPDAVAVKWFKCKLCGRTRKEIVNKEVW